MTSQYLLAEYSTFSMWLHQNLPSSRASMTLWLQQQPTIQLPWRNKGTMKAIDPTW